jgi:antitoxin VapB
MVEQKIGAHPANVILENRIGQQMVASRPELSPISGKSGIHHIDDRIAKWYIRHMTTTIFMNGRSQAVRMPKEMRLPGKKVSIRKLGDGVLIEPIAHATWPPGYFDSIRIEDPAFKRGDQGVMPPSVDLGA